MNYNKPYNTRKEIFLGNILQGILLSQLFTQLLIKITGLDGLILNFYGFAACELYLLCKLAMCRTDTCEFHANDDRVAGMVLGGIVGELMLII